MKNRIPWLLFIGLLNSLTTFAQSYSLSSEWATDLPVSTDGFASYKLKPSEIYTQSFLIKAGQSASIQIEVRNRLSAEQVIKAGLPLLASVTFGLLRQRGPASGVEQPHTLTNLSPYITGGALASGVSIGLSPRRKKAYVRLSYRNSSGTVLHTDGQWIDVGKTNSIKLKSEADGWVDMFISASSQHGLNVKQIKHVILNNKDTSVNTPVSTPTVVDKPVSSGNARSAASEKPTGPSADSTTGPQTNKMQPCGNCPPPPDESGGGIMLPEVVVVGQYNYGTYDMDWSNFVSNFNTMPTDIGSYVGAAASGGSGGPGPGPNYIYVTQLPQIPSRADAYNKAYRYPKACNALPDVWSWGYKNNDPVQTVEMAGYILEDGTYLSLPWNGNDPVTSHFQTAGPVTGAYSNIDYTIYQENGSLYVQVNNRQNGTSPSKKVIGYMHSHPWTDSGHAYSDPTPQTPSQQYGDYQLSHDFGIPGYILYMDPGTGKLQVKQFRYDQTSGQETVVGNYDLETFCDPT